MEYGSVSAANGSLTGSGGRFYPINDSNLSGSTRTVDGQNGQSGLDAQKAKLRKASRDFEAIFVRELLKSMRSTLQDGGMFGSGAQGEIFSGMMDDAVASKIAERGDLGLGNILYQRMVQKIDATDTTGIVIGGVMQTAKENGDE
jgi:peptidoglycan hydrolase FlgJ